MNIADLKAGETIMKYQSQHMLDREHTDIYAWFDREWAAVERVANVAKALLGGGSDVLAKAASTDIETARGDVAALKKRYAAEHAKVGDGFLQSLALGHRIAAVMTEYRKRMEAHHEEKRRSRRLNDAWNAMPANGPWSTPNVN